MTRPICPARLSRTSLCGILALALILSPAAGGTVNAEEAGRSYRDVVDRLRQAGLAGERAFSWLERITSVGPRLTGSPEAATAVDLSLRLMQEIGLDNVHAEPVLVGRWIRGGAARAEAVEPETSAKWPLSVCALGGSVGTPGSGITAPVVEVKSLADLPRLGPSVKGKVVFFNRPMDRGNSDPFSAYGGAGDQRVRGAAEAARYGAAAVLVRSLTFRVDDHPHTGLMQYDDGLPRIPAAAVSTMDADALSDLLKRAKNVSVSMWLDCRSLEPVESANVVGEITGAELSRDIILIGGHLDSWDLGTGAHDDGAGCAAALEALCLIRDLGLRPRRTIRAVLFMDEEFGGTGGRAYALAPQRKGERHLFAAESDRGGFMPVGLAAGGRDRKLLEKVTSLAALFRPLGVSFIVPGGGGVDVAPLVERGAAPAAVILNSQAYFDVHHSSLDVLSSVHPRELEFQAIILAALAYILAQEGI